MRSLKLKGPSECHLEGNGPAMDPHIDSSPECLDHHELQETWKSGVLIKNLPEVSSDYFVLEKHKQINRPVEF